MTKLPTDLLIESLAAQAGPVTPLASPLRRALAAVAALGLAIGAAVLLFAFPDSIAAQAADGRGTLGFELASMAVTAVLAIFGAFHLAVPGRSRAWAYAPLAPFAAWFLLSGVGSYRVLANGGHGGWELGESVRCLRFILMVSAIVATPLIWRLSRARPITPGPVAWLGGLGAGAASAFALHFFHPFAITFVDLGVHLLTILLVAAIIRLLDRRVLRPA